MITGAQIRAGRKLLGWTKMRLGAASGIPFRIIVRAEGRHQDAPITVTEAAAIRRALELAGVTFTAESGEGPHVRLRGHERAADRLSDEAAPRTIAVTILPSLATFPALQALLRMAHPFPLIAGRRFKRDPHSALWILGGWLLSLKTSVAHAGCR